MAIEIRSIWEAGRDLPAFSIRQGDEIVELADGRIVLRRQIEAADLPESLPGLLPVDPENPTIGDVVEVDAAILRYHLGRQSPG